MSDLHLPFGEIAANLQRQLDAHRRILAEYHTLFTQLAERGVLPAGSLPQPPPERVAGPGSPTGG